MLIVVLNRTNLVPGGATSAPPLTVPIWSKISTLLMTSEKFGVVIAEPRGTVTTVGVDGWLTWPEGGTVTVEFCGAED
jgi:hypothetical protein